MIETITRDDGDRLSKLIKVGDDYNKHKAMDMDELFRECNSSTKYDVPKSPITLKVDKLLSDIEDNYQGLGTAYAEREKEKEDLKKKLSDAEKKLSSIKNPSNLAKMNYTHREEITKKLSKAREELRKEIQRCKVRLDEIKIEEGDTEKEKKDTPKGKRKVHDAAKEKKDTPNQTEPNPLSDKWNMNPYSDFI